MTRQRKPIGFPTMAEAIEVANRRGFPYAVQAWSSEDHPTDFVVAHGSGDGIGKTVYATIKTTRPTRIRSITEIGALWPACSCGHIAQDHHDHGCDVKVKGHCPTCGLHGGSATCPCKGYDAMTDAQWFALLTPDEIAHYHFSAPSVTRA